MFANPLFLWALTAAAIPLMLHMFQRRRTVVTPFPTLRFLKAAQKRSSSRVRFENLIIWLLRTLLVCSIALAFAQPVLKQAAGGILGRTDRDIAIVLDGSYSMNYEMERAKVWESCKDAAEKMINGLKAGDRVCVYLAAETPVPVIEKPTTERATVVQAIRALTLTDASAKLEDAVAMAVRTLEQQDGKREKELYIFTDGQARSWQGFRESADASAPTGAAPAGEARAAISRESREKIAFFAMLAGALHPDNAYPATLKVSPALMLAGQSARVSARIGRSGPAKELSVALLVDGEEKARRSLTAEADTETPIEFVLGGLEPGIHLGKLVTPQDALPEDDAFEFLLRVNRQLPVLIVGTDDASRYLKAALAPGAADESVKTLTPEEIDGTDLRDYQAVFLCDAFPLSGQAILRLETYVSAGGVLCIFPGERADAAAYAEMKILPAAPDEIEPVDTDQSTRTLRHVPNKPGQVVTFSLALPPGALPTVALKRTLTLGDLQENAATLITAGPDTPFLTGRVVGRGRVFLFSVGADRTWSTLPLTAFFVPIVHQLIRQGAGASVQPTHLTLGTAMPANEAIPLFREDDSIMTPSGASLVIKDTGDRTYFIEELPEVGIYTRAKASGAQPEPVLAVNTDRSESDLTPATPEEIKSWTGFKRLVTAQDAEELLRLIDEHRNGRSLTELFLWLVVLLAAAEWWFANRALRARTGATEKMKVDLAGKVTTA
ncbi:MAG: VWA domain-containing protein [Kiritimatiellae bacterium]|nr:VWA domain-containing protein [Kiritimatiellia bacterium]